jgi:hypothetical protein
MKSRETKLLVIWLLLTGLAFVTQVTSRQFAPPSVQATNVWGDACLSTCPANVPCIYEYYFTDECCIWDWGCWLNPFQPDYQLGPCYRMVKKCIVES